MHVPSTSCPCRATARRKRAMTSKGFGYGSPLFVEYEVAGERRKAVLETMAPSTYGHDHFSDRAQSILWEHSAFNDLPRHVRSLDSGAFLDSGRLLSTGSAREFFLLTEYVDGTGYFKDLERLRNGGPATEQDFSRVEALAAYVAEIHAKETGFTRSLYPPHPRPSGTRRMHHGNHRQLPALLRVHRSGTFCSASKRPAWNGVGASRTGQDDSARYTAISIPGTSCSGQARTLPCSTGHGGNGAKPADDVATMSINYLFFSLQRSGRMEGDLGEPVPAVLGHLPGTHGRPRDVRSHRAFLCMAGAGHRQPGLVSPPRRGSPPKALHVHRECACRAPLRSGRRDEVPGMSGGFALWLTGIPASGKSSITRGTGPGTAGPAGAGRRARIGPFADYSDAEPELQRRRAGPLLSPVGPARAGHHPGGVNVIFDATANKRAYRDRARGWIQRFVEVYLDCPLQVCTARDPKGIYAGAARNKTGTVPGLQAAYEPPRLARARSRRPNPSTGERGQNFRKTKTPAIHINSSFLPIYETHLTGKCTSITIPPMGKKVTYERWINLFLPDGWNEREEMGFVLLEKEGWPGMMQLSFIEREETRHTPSDAARNYLEDTLEERDIPFPREAVKIEDRGNLECRHDGLYLQRKGRGDPLAGMVPGGQDACAHGGLCLQSRIRRAAPGRSIDGSSPT